MTDTSSVDLLAPSERTVSIVLQNGTEHFYQECYAVYAGLLLLVFCYADGPGAQPRVTFKADQVLMTEHAGPHDPHRHQSRPQAPSEPPTVRPAVPEYQGSQVVPVGSLPLPELPERQPDVEELQKKHVLNLGMIRARLNVTNNVPPSDFDEPEDEEDSGFNEDDQETPPDGSAEESTSESQKDSAFSAAMQIVLGRKNDEGESEASWSPSGRSWKTKQDKNRRNKPKPLRGTRRVVIGLAFLVFGMYGASFSPQAVR